MGNANIIYENRCLDYSISELKYCPVYKEHLKTEKILKQYGMIFEKLVYQNPDHLSKPGIPKISWYQLMGQSVKSGGQAMHMADPFRNNIIMTGKAEKLIGQMEDDFSVVCNSLILRPIQEIRIHCQTVVRCHYKLFLDNYRHLKALDNKASSMKPDGPGFCQLLKELEEGRRVMSDIHVQLHKDVIYVYQSLVNIKLKIPAMLEHQLQLNKYSVEYLEYVLHSFKDNKKTKHQIIPLRSFRGDFKSYIPDYRQTLHDTKEETDFEKPQRATHDIRKNSDDIPVFKRDDMNDKRSLRSMPSRSVKCSPTPIVPQSQPNTSQRSNVASKREPSQQIYKRRQYTPEVPTSEQDKTDKMEDDIKTDNTRYKEINKPITRRHPIPAESITTPVYPLTPDQVNVEPVSNEMDARKNLQTPVKKKSKPICGKRQKQKEPPKVNQEPVTAANQGRGLSEGRPPQNEEDKIPANDAVENRMGSKTPEKAKKKNTCGKKKPDKKIPTTQQGRSLSEGKQRENEEGKQRENEEGKQRENEEGKQQENEEGKQLPNGAVKDKNSTKTPEKAKRKNTCGKKKPDKKTPTTQHGRSLSEGKQRENEEGKQIPNGAVKDKNVTKTPEKAKKKNICGNKKTAKKINPVKEEKEKSAVKDLSLEISKKSERKDKSY